MQRLDEVLKLCRQYDIKAVIDLHAGPGNRISKVSGNEIETGLDVDTLTEAWRRMAKRCKGNPSICGYGMLNEPVNNRTPSVDLQQRTAERVTSTIRAIDRKTPSLLRWNSASPNMEFLLVSRGKTASPEISRPVPFLPLSADCIDESRLFWEKNLCTLDFDKEIWYNIICNMKRFMF